MTYYEHFCPEHIGMLIVLAAIIVTVLITIKRYNDEKVTSRVLKILAVGLFFGELNQDLLLYNEGVDYMTYLPIHLCNQGIFVNLLAVFTKGKVSEFFSEVSAVLIMPGALGAILFPDWNYRPFWNWLGISCFFTHLLLVMIPIILISIKKARIVFTRYWFSLLYIAVVTPPILWFDNTFKHNYMFLRFPVSGSPLEWVYDLSNGEHYILGLIGLLLFVLLIEYSLAFVIRKASYGIINAARRKSR